MSYRRKLMKFYRRQITVLPKRRKSSQIFSFLIIILILFFLICLSLIFHHHHLQTPIAKNRRAQGNRNNFYNALAANLVTLHKYQQVTKKSTLAPMFSRLQRERRAQSRRIQLRQNAPTQMYSKKMIGQQSLYSYRANNVVAPIFFEKNTYTMFANKATRTTLAEAQRLPHPRDTIPQGEFIHAVLETAIDSDLPGMIRAVIVYPVYSYQGNNMLISTGSRLIGQYSSKVVQGIPRIMVIWQRILLPNGISIRVDSPGSDILGRSGLLADHIDSHFIERFRQASLFSLMGLTATNSSTYSYQQAISKSFRHGAAQSLQYHARIKPTLKINQGARVTVFVARDLDFFKVRNIYSDRK